MDPKYLSINIVHLKSVGSFRDTLKIKIRREFFKECQSKTLEQTYQTGNFIHPNTNEKKKDKADKTLDIQKV